MFEEYLLSFHRDELLEILANQNETRHFSININFIELLGRKIELAKDLLDDPDKSLEEWEKAATAAQLSLLKQVERKFELKLNVHCRIYYLAHLARHYIFPGNKDVGKFIQISGTVMRLTAAKCLEFQRNYVCTTCKTPVLVKADYNRKYNIIKQPKRCQNPDCNSTNLIHFGELDSENCKDYQEIKIQEQVKKLGIGSIPNAIKVTLEDDLVDSCQPGDDVTICGIVKRQFGEFNLGKRTEIDLVFKANHVQVDTNSSFSISTPETKNMFNSFWEKYAQNTLEGRDIILKSFCTEIYGLYPVKLALAVVLAGGCPIEDINLTGVRTRSESHLLLVGDPGTGKSHLLRFASKIVPRAVLTTGVGSTAAGLTVTATMEHGEWQLEAGALVMADGGICCIDEFNSMKEHDRTTIHEAMEQQTISVAKASMVCKLNSRCSILAACNPKGNLDPTQPLSMNVALPSPLLSRFDLVMLLRDTVNQEWDELVMDYILNGGTILSKLTESGLWPINILQSYFKIIKNLQPKLTEDAEIILSSYYNLQRKLTSRNKARTTVRLLESLVRLSQGHARLMYHEKVLVIDSIYAVFLVDFSMDPESSIFNLNMPSNTVFPQRPKSAYRNLLETVLSKLQLEQILNNELDQLKNGGEREGILQSRFFANAQIVDKSGSNDKNAQVIATSSTRNENKTQEQNVTERDSKRVVSEEVNTNGNENRDEEEAAAKNINRSATKCDSNKDNSKKIIIIQDITIRSDNESKKDNDKNMNIGFENTSVGSDAITTYSKTPKLSKKNPLKRFSFKSTSVNNDIKLLKEIPSVNDGFCADLDLDWESEGVVENSQSSIKLIDSKRVVNKENNKNDNGNRAEGKAKNIGRHDANKKNPEKINKNHNKTVGNANMKEKLQVEDKSHNNEKNVELTAKYSRSGKNEGQQQNVSKYVTKKVVNEDANKNDNGNGVEEKEEKNINNNAKKCDSNKENPTKINEHHNKIANNYNETEIINKKHENVNICFGNTSVSSDDITTNSQNSKLSIKNSLKRFKFKASRVQNDTKLPKGLDWNSDEVVENSQSSIDSKRLVNVDVNKNHNGNSAEEEAVRIASIKQKSQFEDKCGSNDKIVEITAKYSRIEKNEGQQHNVSKHDTKRVINENANKNDNGNRIQEKVEKNIKNSMKYDSNKKNSKEINEKEKHNVNICFKSTNGKKTEYSINDQKKKTIIDDDITNKSKKPKLSNKNSLKRINSKANSVNNDMELLKWVPSVNDGFCADLDMDWDSEGAVEDSQSSIKLIDSNASSHSKLSNLSIFNSCEDMDFDI